MQDVASNVRKKAFWRMIFSFHMGHKPMLQQKLEK